MIGCGYEKPQQRDAEREAKARKKARRLSWDGYLAAANWDVLACREAYMGGESLTSIIGSRRFLYTSGPLEGQPVGTKALTTAYSYGWKAARQSANESATMAAAREAGKAHAYHHERALEERLKSAARGENPEDDKERIEHLGWLKATLDHAKAITSGLTKPKEIAENLTLVDNLRRQIQELEGRGPAQHDDHGIDPEDQARSEAAKANIEAARQRLKAEQEAPPAPGGIPKHLLYGAPPEILAKVKEHDVEAPEGDQAAGPEDQPAHQGMEWGGPDTDGSDPEHDGGDRIVHFDRYPGERESRGESQDGV